MVAAREPAAMIALANAIVSVPSAVSTAISWGDVVIARDFDGLSPGMIVELVYPFLTLGRVYAALAYYEDHREEIDAAERREAEVMEQFKRDHPDLVVDLRSQRME
jgi:uncharacterized protein (DUF433 family)